MCFYILIWLTYKSGLKCDQFKGGTCPVCAGGTTGCTAGTTDCCGGPLVALHHLVAVALPQVVPVVFEVVLVEIVVLHQPFWTTWFRLSAMSFRLMVRFLVGVRFFNHAVLLFPFPSFSFYLQFNANHLCKCFLYFFLCYSK